MVFLTIPACRRVFKIGSDLIEFRRFSNYDLWSRILSFNATRFEIRQKKQALPLRYFPIH